MFEKKGKTEYRFLVHDTAKSEQTIREWLSANGFQQMQENGDFFYRSGDGVVSAYHFFEYTIQGSQVNLYAYMHSHKHPIALEHGNPFGTVFVAAYENTLEPLLATMNQMSSDNNSQKLQGDTNGMNPQNNSIPTATPQENNTQSQPIQQPQVQTQLPQDGNVYNEFQAKTNKRNNTFAEVSFWISIALVVLAFFGRIIGLLLIVVNYFLAAQGLKSEKKKKATAALVMTSVATLIMVLGYIGVLLGILTIE